MSYNAWAFGYGNPVNLTDPSGHDPWWCDEQEEPRRTKCILGHILSQASTSRGQATTTSPRPLVTCPEPPRAYIPVEPPDHYPTKRTFIDMFGVSSYIIPVESQVLFGGTDIPIRAHENNWTLGGRYLSRAGGYTNDPGEVQTAKSGFLYRGDFLCYQGTGRLLDGRYIGCSPSQNWTGVKSPNDLSHEGFYFSWRTVAGVNQQNRPYETAASCNNGRLPRGTPIEVPDLMPLMERHQADTRLTITNYGGHLCEGSAGRVRDAIDIYVGEGDPGYENYREVINFMVRLTYVPVFRLSR